MYDGIDKNDKKVLIALSPDYANIGDIAIYLVQRMILKNIFPDRKIIEIPMDSYHDLIDELVSVINDDDIITIIGGGNMGSIYKGSEARRRDLVTRFPNNRIIGFPQSTSYYSNNKDLIYDLYLKIYDEYPNIKFFFREEKSYDFIKSKINNDVYMVPDMAMYLVNKLDFDKNIERDKILLCFRSDFEKNSTNDIVDYLINILTNLNDVETIDTYLGDYKFDLSKREEMFKNMINKFREAKVILTDRLHGMILSLITKTPCIAFDNLTKKISATYDTWLKDIPYIKCVEEISGVEIIKMINDFTKIDTESLSYDFEQDFAPLFKVLKDLENE